MEQHNETPRQAKALGVTCCKAGCKGGQIEDHNGHTDGPVVVQSFCKALQACFGEHPSQGSLRCIILLPFVPFCIMCLSH